MEGHLKVVASMPEKVASVLKDLRMTVCMAVLPNITLKNWVEKMVPKRGDIVIISYTDKDAILTCQGHFFEIFKSHTEMSTTEHWDIRLHTYNKAPLKGVCTCVGCMGSNGIPDVI